MQWHGRAPSAPHYYYYYLLSIVPEKGTLGAHQKRSGITYVTYMVVMPLILMIVGDLHVSWKGPFEWSVLKHALRATHETSLVLQKLSEYSLA